MAEITHHFGDKFYAKGARFAAGEMLSQHKHKSDHASFLESGAVVVYADGNSEIYKGPVWIIIKAGTAHSVRAVTNAVWYCVHRSDVKDEESIDDSLIAERVA